MFQSSATSGSYSPGLIWHIRPHALALGDLNPTTPTTFRVTKNFSDDNPGGVTVAPTCNTGLPLMQTGLVHDPDAVGLGPGDFTTIEFVVRDFLAGTLDCNVDEVIPGGYEPNYMAGGIPAVAENVSDDEFGCHYQGISFGHFTCDIFNGLQPVGVIVEKEWIDEHPEFFLPTPVEVTLQCDGPIDGGYPCLSDDGNGNHCCLKAYIDPNNPGEFPVFPDFEGTKCFATESPITDAAADQGDCSEMIVFPGQGASCTIFNTRLFEGIPMFSQYGLIVLVLMMLGIGAVAYRR